MRIYGAHLGFVTYWKKRNTHYRIHKRPQLVHISQKNSVHLISLKSILILFSHVRLGLSCGLFLSGSPTKTLYALFSHSCYMHCPSDPPSFHYSNYIWQGAYVIKLPITQLSPPPIISSVLVQNSLLGALI
jgi:hypothetical protein